MTEPDLGDSILRLLLDPLMDEFLRNARTKLVELNAVRDKVPITTNHYFRDTVAKMRRDRDIITSTQVLTNFFEETDCADSETLPGIIEALHPHVEPEMDRAAAEDVFDYMMTFYNVRYSLP